MGRLIFQTIVRIPNRRSARALQTWLAVDRAPSSTNDSVVQRRYRSSAMAATRRIEGYAIVSADGMIADANGVMPPTLRNGADQRFLQAELDRAAVVVHGRHSYEGGPRAPARKRLIVTRQLATTAPDASPAGALLWNPAGTPLETALALLGVGDGSVAVIGGTDVFGLFLPRYDAFHLTRAAHAAIPGGRPVFPQVGPRATAEDVLAREGFRAKPRRDIDAAAGITLTTWQRQRG
jgi:dihydrofolate reductase